MGRTAASLALLAAVLLTSVAAQQAQSRQNGEADPAFVADAQAVADLMAAGFLSPEDAKAAVRVQGRAPRQAPQAALPATA